MAAIRLSTRREEVLDDLEMLFDSRLESIGRKRAERLFTKDALNIAFLGLGEAQFDVSRPSILFMYKSYFKSSTRAMRLHKSFASINIIGLAIGMAASLIILQYVSFESGFDDYPGSERVYRIRNNYIRFGGQIYNSAGTFPGVAPTLKESLPEVEEYARVLPYNAEFATILTRDDAPLGPVAFKETRLLFVDGSFPEMFNLHFVSGDPASSLSQPNSVVLTESAASRYFGGDDPVGQTLRFNDDGQSEHLLLVAAVVDDAPTNSHIPYDVLVSYSTLFGRDGGDLRYNTWWSGQAKYHTYLRLRKDAGSQAVLAALPAMLDLHKPDYKDTDERGERLRRNEFALDPVREIHASSVLENDIATNGNGGAVFMLLLIAGLILVIAWVNYVNLAAARAMERAKEVGVRKVLGSTRSQLIQQFLCESALLNLIGFALSILLALLAQPFLSALLGGSIPHIWTDSSIWYGLVATFAVGAIVAGISPALFLSSFLPAGVLKGQLGARVRSGLQRKFLVVFQFAVAVALIVGTMTVYQQLEFMQSRNLGFDQEQMLVIQRPGILDGEFSQRAQQVEAFKTSLSGLGDVSGIAGSGAVPGQMILRGLAMGRGNDSESSIESVEGIAVDYAFLETYQMEFVQGRNFSIERADSNAVIFNETAIRLLGYDSVESAVGTVVRFLGELHPIVGVIRDYHHDSLHRLHDPMFFVLAPSGGDLFFTVKISSTDLQRTLSSIEQTFQSHFLGNPFEYFFLDESLAAQYAADRTFGEMFRFFAGLAIFIAFLGLYGLSSFVTMRRTREIGIRKVNGATVPNIVTLLSVEFLVPVTIGFLIAVPVSYLAIQAWLDTFAFRIEFSPVIFLLAGSAVLLVALLSVMQASLRAARLRPVEGPAQFMI